MALSLADRSALRKMFSTLRPEPLEPGDERYEPIYRSQPETDPVEILIRSVEYSEHESRLLFSGFRGAGKTTELYRVRQRLQDQGYVVVFADYLDYLDDSEEVGISELLIVLAGGFSDSLSEGYQLNIGTDSYWDRIVHWLKTTDVNLKEMTVKSGAEFKLELKSAPTFRQAVAQALSTRVGELYKQVRTFFAEAVHSIRAQRGEDVEIAYIFDSLERVQGARNEQQVMRSVESLFSNYLNLLAIPNVHAIYTVPPWIKFVLPGLETHFLPCVSMWQNDQTRTVCREGFQAMELILEKRLGLSGLELLFGKDHKSRVEGLVSLCGGHIRDLLYLVREVILRAAVLPASEEAVQSAIASVRSAFLPIPLEDAQWLAGIADRREALLKTTSPDEVNRLTLLIDYHLVLYLKEQNREWYDIHPIIRDEVYRLATLRQLIEGGK